VIKRRRHRKANPYARCCWICGREGGAGFTIALRMLGFDVQKGDIAHAHTQCVQREQRRMLREKR
jgi:hypothetical protein